LGLSRIYLEFCYTEYSSDCIKMEISLSRNGARPKSNRQKTHPHNSGKTHTDRMAGVIDALIQFEDFNTKILPALQADVKNKMTTKELREKYASLVQARLITDILLTDDAGKAATAGKDLLDRVDGKAAEKKEVTHKFAELKDEEIDAILKSEIEDLEDMESRFDS
jgi:hypothetical protein